MLRTRLKNCAAADSTVGSLSVATEPKHALFTTYASLLCWPRPYQRVVHTSCLRRIISFIFRTHPRRFMAYLHLIVDGGDRFNALIAYYNALLLVVIVEGVKIRFMRLVHVLLFFFCQWHFCVPFLVSLEAWRSVALHCQRPLSAYFARDNDVRWWSSDTPRAESHIMHTLLAALPGIVFRKIWKSLDYFEKSKLRKNLLILNKAIEIKLM